MKNPRFTDVGLITDNRAALQAKRHLIAQAEHSLDLVYFIVDDDATTARLLLDLVAAAGRGVRVRLVVDYFLTYQHADVLRSLVGIQNLEVHRYGAPDSDWLEALTEAGINRSEFIGALTEPSAERLKKSLRDNPVIPQRALMLIEELKVRTTENRWAFALNVLEALREVIPNPELIRQMQPTAIGHLAQFLGSGPRLSLGTLSRLGAMVVPISRIVRGLDQFLHRTHHKLLLADNRRFIMGGRNLADAYQRDVQPGVSGFRDTDVQACASAPGATEHAAAFDVLWEDSIDLALPDPLDLRLAQPLKSLEALAAGFDDTQAQAALASIVALPDMDGEIFNNLPSNFGDSSITAEYIRRIDAQSRQGTGVIDIVSAYVCLGSDAMGSDFLPQLYQSLFAAALAHVTVNIHTNSATTTDLKAINKAAYADLAKLIDVGVNVFELEDKQGTLHTKAAAIGDDCLIVGSYNLDPRSELYDTNNMIVLRDTSGKATRAFRQASIDSLVWERLTADRARQLAADQSKATLLSIARRLL